MCVCEYVRGCQLGGWMGRRAGVRICGLVGGGVHVCVSL